VYFARRVANQQMKKDSHLSQSNAVDSALHRQSSRLQSAHTHSHSHTYEDVNSAQLISQVLHLADSQSDYAGSDVIS